ncbi:hypothetical protein DFJ58DRAFT_749957 [Suillus subalutaceus]|uniref:uncharacterized protein n=1 Tax=Suillus subalutaceus TaxID=48586 RepID=UPI001B86AB8A|nr:uncharacterized protein DFJ58DRAFT_749957 [Suillus subalutaceus]KAG1836003.1 hypothetical protein DFJ58DRAFT_749957 [Suillus subalutaceus]
MRYLLGPNLVCLRLASPKPDLWTDTVSSLFSGLSRHSPRLEVLELHATSSEVAELTLCGLPHLQRVWLTLRSNKALSYVTRLIGLYEVYITVPIPCGGGNLQFSSSSLRKVMIHSSTLTSVGNIVEGWVVQCRSLDWRGRQCACLWQTKLALLLLTKLRKGWQTPACTTPRWRGTPLHRSGSCTAILKQRSPWNAPCASWTIIHITVVWRRIVIHGPKSVDRDDYAFHLRTFTPLMRFSRLKEVLLPSFCMPWLDDDALGTIVKSWPCLERLDLGTAHFWQTPLRVTFRGLVTLLSSCPNLENPGLVFDTTNVVICRVLSDRTTTASRACAFADLTVLERYVEPWAWDVNQEARRAKWSKVLNCIGAYGLTKQPGLCA